MVLGGFPKLGFRVEGLGLRVEGLGYLFGGPNNKDHRILGSICPLFWETTI